MEPPSFAATAILLLIVLSSNCTADVQPVQASQEVFDSLVASLPAEEGLLMEFYAGWCPTCQHFQPEYEKIAAYFHTLPRVQPQVTVARIDCAKEAGLCF